MHNKQRDSVRVSIGLPVFNGERYLPEALESCLAQTYSGFELIVSDNASTDRTQLICETYAAKDSRIRYYRNEVNMGIVPNFNRTFALSSTEYFKWAPYDDLIAPNFLERCVSVLDSNPEYILCYTKAIIIDDEGRYEVDYDPGPPTESTRPERRFRQLMLHPEYAIQQMGLFRSDVLRRTLLHGSFPSCDEVLLAELSLMGPFYEIPERLYIYRRHRAQSTSQPKQRDRVLLFDASLAHRIVLPKWRYFAAAWRVIGRHRLNLSTRMSCYGTMLRWLIVGPHFRAMGKDVLLAVRQAMRSLIHFAGVKHRAAINP